MYRYTTLLSMACATLYCTAVFSGYLTYECDDDHRKHVIDYLNKHATFCGNKELHDTYVVEKEKNGHPLESPRSHATRPRVCKDKRGVIHLAAYAHLRPTSPYESSFWVSTTRRKKACSKQDWNLCKGDWHEDVSNFTMQQRNKVACSTVAAKAKMQSPRKTYHLQQKRKTYELNYSGNTLVVTLIDYTTPDLTAILKVTPHSLDHDKLDKKSVECFIQQKLGLPSQLQTPLTSIERLLRTTKALTPY